jgi:hypothetical protein
MRKPKEEINRRTMTRITNAVKNALPDPETEPAKKATVNEALIRHGQQQAIREILRSKRGHS